jgi:RNA polymerase sigma factor (sigma-70 family)
MMNPEELLAHADFVQVLAGSLVADDDHAADIVQQTWIAALKNPPARDDSTRFWFSRVIRNLAATRRRNETRRVDREKRASRPEKVYSAAEVVERAEMRHRVVEAVLGLSEPYKSSILLRYYEDLAPREIAESEGIPVETVRTRIKRGLARLREKLDRDFGGRGAWCLALAPIAGLDAASLSVGTITGASVGATTGTAVGATTGTTALLSGGILLATKMKLGIAAVALLCTGLFLWQALEEKETDINNSGELAGLKTSINGSGSPAGNERDDGGGGNLQKGAGSTIPILPSGLFVSGRVTDEFSGKPVSAFEFKLLRKADDKSPSQSGWDEVINETMRESDGAFRFSLKRGGLHKLTVSTSRHLQKVIGDLEIPEAAGLQDLEILLDPGFEISGSVLDDTTDKPVAGAIVGSAESKKTDLVQLLRERKEGTVYSVTDEDGRFSLCGLSNKRQEIAAVHPDYAEGNKAVTPGQSRGVEIRLKSGPRIFGRALDDEGRPRADVLITFSGEELPLRRSLLSAADGRYRSPPLRPGEVEVSAWIPRWLESGDSEFASEIKRAVLVDEDIEINFGPLAEHVTWRGIFYDQKDVPQAGGSLILDQLVIDKIGIVRHGSHHGADCDETGSFEFRKLLPGRYRLTPYLTDRSTPDGFEKTVVFDAPGLSEFDFRLRLPDRSGNNCSVNGLLINGETGTPFRFKKEVYVWAMRMAPTRQHEIVNPQADGSFFFPALAPGNYDFAITGGDLLRTRISGIPLKGGENLKNLHLVVPSHGQLRVRLAGFREKDPRTFKIGLWRNTQLKRISFEDQNLGDDGTWEMTRTCESQGWNIAVAFEKMGFLKRQVEVVPRGLTEIVIKRDDLHPAPEPVHLAGTLTDPDGNPVSGKKLFLRSGITFAAAPRWTAHKVITDSDGTFSFARIHPGIWCATAARGPGAESTLAEFVIPEEGVDSFDINLVLPTGSVRGTLCDKLTGKPTANSGSQALITLNDINHYSTVSMAVDQNGIGHFVLGGVPAGQYFLEVRTFTHFEYRSPSFSHDGCEDIDVGSILLDPCGIIDVEVVGSEGQALTEFEIFCNSNICVNYLRENLADGRFRYAFLPLGKVSLEISAVGHKTGAQTVYLRPGVHAQVRFELDRGT